MVAQRVDCVYSDTSSIPCGVPRVLRNWLATLTELAEGQNDPPSSQWELDSLRELGGGQGERMGLLDNQLRLGAG